MSLKKFIVTALLIALALIPIIDLPWGGAEDKDGDGRVDYFFDGTKKVSLAEYTWLMIKPSK